MGTCFSNCIGEEPISAVPPQESLCRFNAVASIVSEFLDPALRGAIAYPCAAAAVLRWPCMWLIEHILPEAGLHRSRSEERRVGVKNTYQILYGNMFFELHW